MTRTLIAGAVALAFAVQACNPAEEQATSSAPGESTTTATDAMKNMPMPSQAPATGDAGQAQTYTTTGEITEMASDSVTINHEPVPALGWPSMTMTFKAPDSGMTTGLEKGAPVEFSFRQEGSDNVLTAINRR